MGPFALLSTHPHQPRCGDGTVPDDFVPPRFAAQGDLEPPKKRTTPSMGWSDIDSASAWLTVCCPSPAAAGGSQDQAAEPEQGQSARCRHGADGASTQIE